MSDQWEKARRRARRRGDKPREKQYAGNKSRPMDRPVDEGEEQMGDECGTEPPLATPRCLGRLARSIGLRLWRFATQPNVMIRPWCMPYYSLAFGGSLFAPQ